MISCYLFINTYLITQGMAADLDDEDREAERAKFAEEFSIEVYGRKCPDQYINMITPMEFEEIVIMFNEYDVDKSNTIDRHEARKILFNLGMDYSLSQTDELFAIIDQVRLD